MIARCVSISKLIIFCLGREGLVPWVCKAEILQTDSSYAIDEYLLDQSARNQKKSISENWGPDSFHLDVRTLPGVQALWLPPNRGIGRHLIPIWAVLWWCLSPSGLPFNVWHCRESIQDWAEHETAHGRFLPSFRNTVFPLAVVFCPSWLSLHPNLAFCWNSLTNLSPKMHTQEC